MKKKFDVKLFFTELLLALLYCAIFVGGVFLINYLGDIHVEYTNDMLLFNYVLLCVLFALVPINMVTFTQKKEKYLDNKQYRKTAESVLHDYEAAQKDYVSAEKAVLKQRNKIIACKLLLSAFLLLIIFLSSLAAKVIWWDVYAFAVAPAYIALALFPLMWLDLLKPNLSVMEENELDKNQYPVLYQVAEDAKKSIGCRGKVKIYATFDYTMAVSSQGNYINILLDCEETYLLTRDELYQSMLHEMAHVKNSDTLRSRRLGRFVYGMTHGIASVVTKLFFSSQMLEFSLKQAIYQTACNRFYEQNADKAVLEHGNGQSYLNGLAKSSVLSMYRRSYNKTLEYDIYESEEIPADFYRLDLELFNKYLVDSFDKYDLVLRNSIQTRLDTHPTFAMRMEFVGTNCYDLRTKESDENYLAETRALLDLGNRLVVVKTGQDFLAAREEFYLPTKKMVEEYFSKKGQKMSVRQKSRYLESLYCVDRTECLALCDEILTESPKNPNANLFKGLIMAQKLDKNCVEYLYNAADGNADFVETALDAVATFAAQTGDEELLNHYRERATDDYVSMMEKQENSHLHLTDRVTQNILSDVDYNEILQKIVETGGDTVCEVYSVSRRSRNGLLTCYLLMCKADSDDRKCRDIYSKITDYLDDFVDGTSNNNFAVYIYKQDANLTSDARKLCEIFELTEGSLVYSVGIGMMLRGTENINDND